MYFDEREVRALLAHLGAACPGSILLADGLGPWTVRNALQWLHPAVSRTSARFRWGVSSFKELERWGIGVTVQDEWHYLDRHADRWGFLRLARRIGPIRNEMKTARLLLGGPR
jgi:O-methyltransferase involved in polyketide biosynthesis